MTLVIKEGILATDPSLTPTDLLIEDGIIKEIGKISGGKNVVDARGMILFPGFIDAHTHFDMQTASTHTADDFNTGTKAALSGGTTTIVDFATQNKGQTLEEALSHWHSKAKGKCYTHYAFHMAITDWNDGVENELIKMKEAGVTSFKLYMAYDVLKVDDATLYHILKAIKKVDGLVGIHCENGELIKTLTVELLSKGRTKPNAHPLSRPAAVEAEAINRVLAIAHLAKTTVHIVHLSTSQSMEIVRQRRQQGQNVWVETCPQYLLLDESLYLKSNFESAKYVLSPPLRRKKDQEQLWQALARGEIQTISTDHCAFNFRGQKELGYNDFSQIPNGLPGTEHRPQLIYTYGVAQGKVTLKQMTDLLSTHAAKLFGMYPQKGALKVGSDADIVLWNPAYLGTISEDTQIQSVDYTPYEGFGVKGRAEYVWLGGIQVVKNGIVVGSPQGKYIKRGPTQIIR